MSTCAGPAPALQLEPQSRWADEYSAQVLDVATGSGWVIHVKIRRYDGKDVNCGWDVLQAIKNDVAGENATAVEVFPAERNVVNEAPIRHLWVVPESLLNFGLHLRKGLKNE